MKVTVGKGGRLERPKDPEKILAVALTEAAANQNPEGWQQIVKATKFSKIHAIENPKTKLKSYQAIGEGTIQMLRLKDDSLFKSQKCKFDMEADEIHDEHGLPDIEVKKLEIIK